MARPVVGITSYLEQAKSGVWDTQAVFLPWAYAAPVADAGAAVTILPPQAPTPDAVAAVLGSVDGLYLAGGYDVDPERYGQAAHPQTDAPRADRDAWEAALFEGARTMDLPVLGVCRGAQIANVARGGNLVQHVPDVVGHTGYQGGDAIYRRMPVTVEPGTLLATMHPLEREVPVYHHQAIDRLGEGLTVTARSADGLVEAVEDPSLTFCIAVQWHPERDELSALWAAFVAAAAAYRDAR